MVVVAMIGIGVHYVWQTTWSPDFHETTQVSWNGIQKESQKTREAVIIYREGCMWCQALKPHVQNASRSFTTNDPVKFVYVNSRSARGQDILKKIPLDIQSVPAIVLIDKGGHIIQHVNFNGNDYQYPNNDQLFSLKEGVTTPTSSDDIRVNDDMVRAIKEGDWQHD